jgi:hypothetical protein
MKTVCCVVRITFFMLAFASVVSAQIQYTKGGEFVLPMDYRNWPFLSSGLGMTYSNSPIQNLRFSNVFVNTKAFKAFLRKGQWPDKTVLITEDRASSTHPSNRDGRFQTNITFWEAHVKDSSRGGWSCYIILKTSTSAKPQPESAGCLACHVKNGATETTFVQFYPTLIEAAKRAGNYRDLGDVTMEQPAK